MELELNKIEQAYDRFMAETTWDSRSTVCGFVESWAEHNHLTTEIWESIVSNLGLGHCDYNPFHEEVAVVGYFPFTMTDWRESALGTG